MTHHSTAPGQPLQILRLPQVCKVTGLGRSMIYQLESDRRFPCRVRIGARAVGWVESEVQRWLADRIERYRAQASSPPVVFQHPLRFSAGTHEDRNDLAHLDAKRTREQSGVLRRRPLSGD